MSSSEASSTHSSPTLQARPSPQSAPPAFALPRPNRRTSSRSSPSISPIPEDEVFDPLANWQFDPASEARALFDTTQDMKSTLTDLLNCDAVRSDAKMRMWVQTRLMEAELENKRQRRRRVSTPTIVLTPTEEGEERRIGA